MHFIVTIGLGSTSPFRPLSEIRCYLGNIAMKHLGGATALKTLISCKVLLRCVWMFYSFFIHGNTFQLSTYWSGLPFCFMGFMMKFETLGCADVPSSMPSTSSTLGRTVPGLKIPFTAAHWKCHTVCTVIHTVIALPVVHTYGMHSTHHKN